MVKYSRYELKKMPKEKLRRTRNAKPYAAILSSDLLLEERTFGMYLFELIIFIIFF